MAGALSQHADHTSCQTGLSVFSTKKSASSERNLLYVAAQRVSASAWGKTSMTQTPRAGVSRAAMPMLAMTTLNKCMSLRWLTPERLPDIGTLAARWLKDGLPAAISGEPRP